MDTEWKNKDESYWKEKLSKDAYKVTRKKGTEKPFTGKYVENKSSGTYDCICCGTPLFDASTKFDSGTGWPSFYDIINQKNVGLKPDNSFFRKRTEVVCNSCDAHLGHVFDDGPEPTGKRYCVNSVALNFEES